MCKLVSIITPCYNGDKYLDKYFQSILSQTYPSIELIFINDGSTDNTERIALDYGEKLKEKGYRFFYLAQANAGQSAAINQGLRVFNGDYLNWTDADDYLTDNSIETRVRYLEENPQAGLVIGSTLLVDKQYQPIGKLEVKDLYRSSRKMVESYLRGTFVNPCCSTMVRTGMFKNAMNGVMHIEEVREIGQNYQLFLPILFNYPVIFIPEMLSFCVIHPDSHSHSQKSFGQMIHIQDVTNETLHHIADRIVISKEDKAWFKEKIAEYYFKNRLELLHHYHRKDGLVEIVSQLKQLDAYDISSRKKVLKIKYPFIKKMGDSLWKLKNR